MKNEPRKTGIIKDLTEEAQQLAKRMSYQDNMYSNNYRATSNQPKTLMPVRKTNEN